MVARRGVFGVFGEETVDVAIDPSNCVWIVKATDGRVLMQVPWLWIYDQRQLGDYRKGLRSDFLTEDEYVTHRSRWEAFEVCLCAYPLTSEDKRLLDLRYPGITTQRQYRVRNPIWQPAVREDERSVEQRTPPPSQTTANVVRQPPAAVASTPLDTTQVPETAHEAGERKLLL